MSLLYKPLAPEEQLTIPGLEPKREPLMTRKQVLDEQKKARNKAQTERRQALQKIWVKDCAKIDEHKKDADWLNSFIRDERKKDKHHDMRHGQTVLLLNGYERAIILRALLPTKRNPSGYKSIRQLLVDLAEKSLKVK